MLILIIILAAFFALNMGGASFGASFAASYGSKVTTRISSTILFILFVILGAVTLGENVSNTLGNNITSSEHINNKGLVVIFLSAGISMFISNVMKIPQSTSLVTVAAIAGVGVYLNDINLNTFYFMLPFWVLLPVIAFGITHLIGGYIYPPRKQNFWIYQKFINQQSKLKAFVVIASCFNAFSVGTNNVGNVVGPLIANQEGSILNYLLIFGLIYGCGAAIFFGPIKTAGDKIVPLGLLTASIISLVSGTLMIIASYFGVPQSFVMLQIGAIFAISSLKEGATITFSSPLAKKTFYTWTINPMLTFLVAIGLSKLILR